MTHSRIGVLFGAILFTLLSAPYSAALEVAPDSPCAPKCIDDPRTGNVSDRSSSLTFNPDLPCYDWEVTGSNSTQAGIKFKECNNCMKSSGYAWTTAVERDTTWFLFNNRAVVDWCIFGRFAEEKNDKLSESSIYKTCNSRCNQIYESADYTIKSNPDSYSFCDYNGNFSTNADSCLDCLYSTPGLIILGNVLSTVVDLCKQKPGKTYSFPNNQEIYASTKISLSSTAASSSPSSSSSPKTSNTPAAGSDGLSKGAIAGIVLGALVGIAAILGGLLLLLRRRKNKNKAGAATELNGEQFHGGGNEYSFYPANEAHKSPHALHPVEMDQTTRAEMGTHMPVNELPTGRY